MIKCWAKYLILAILILFFSNCTKGPTVTDIVRGIYKAENNKANNATKRIRIITGDTLYSISQKYKITIKEIIEFNNIKAPYVLKPGRFLNIPKAKKYKIVKGDTLFKIANCHKISVEEIKIKNSRLREKKLLVSKIINLPYYAVNRCNFKKYKKNNTLPNKAKGALSKGIFEWPTKGTLITKYGKQKGGRRNDGINILSAKGNPVRAALQGKVIYKGNELPAWGNLILIKHRNNWTTAYAHLEKFLVNKGEIVKTGDIIGSVGSTGNVEGYQLHFQVRKNSKPLDPLKYLKNP